MNNTLHNSELSKSHKISHFTMFAFLWAISLLVHYFTEPVNSSTILILFIPSILILARPQQGYFLIAAAIGHVIIFMLDPVTSGGSNHHLLQFLINIFLIVSSLWIILSNLIKTRKFTLDIDRWFDLFRPFLVLAIIIVYLMSVLNKLNTSFLDPNLSDVTRLTSSFYSAKHLFFIPDLLPKQIWFLQLLIIATLIIEVIIPVCLLLKPFRLLGILIGFGFHLILTIRVYPPALEFPTLLFAIYILALPDTSIPVIQEIWAKFKGKNWFSSSKYFVVSAIAWFFFWLPLVFTQPINQYEIYFSRNEMLSYFWVIYIVLYGVCLVYVLFRLHGGFKEPHDIKWIQRKHLVAHIFTIIIILNGFSPYLGIKNDGNWNMYSSIRTESDMTNHLFMPVVYIAPYLKVVCITDSSDGNLTLSAYNGKLFTYLDFLEWANKNPDDSVKFYYEDNYYDLERVGDHPEFGRKMTFLESLLPIKISGNQLKHWLWCQQYDPYNEDKSTEVRQIDFSFIPWQE